MAKQTRSKIPADVTTVRNVVTGESIDMNVTITATMTERQAEAMAQFFKRIGHDDYKRLAAQYHPTELEDMKAGGNRFQEALAEAGFEPR